MEVEFFHFLLPVCHRILPKWRLLGFENIVLKDYAYLRDVTSWIYLFSRLIKKLAKKVCIQRFISNIFRLTVLQAISSYEDRLFKIRVFFHLSFRRNEVGDPSILCISNISNSLSNCGEKKSVLNYFCVNVLKPPPPLSRPLVLWTSSDLPRGGCEYRFE